MIKLKKLHDHDMSKSPTISMGYMDSYLKLAKARSIFISENITKELAIELSAMLLYYDNNSDEPITIYLNTNGGDAAGLTNIYDVMQIIDSPINTICLGKCYSAGSIILAAGSKGKRFAMKNSKIMIHGIQCGFPIPGQDILNSKNYYEYLKDNNDDIMKILAKHTNRTLADLKLLSKRDIWLDPSEAIEFGVIDEIL